MSRSSIVGGSDGWLNVKSESSGSIVALPEHLSVEITKSESSRDYFVVLEGVYKGKNFSVKQGNLRSAPVVYQGAAHVEINLTRETLSFPGSNITAVTAEGQRAIAVGAYPIQIPDFPHELGAAYSPQSRYAKTWFYLGHGVAVRGNNDRYLHTGRVSAGCVTVDPSGWTRLYQYLITRRSGDGKNVGSLVVKR